ncbi:MAG: hypothetical protein HC887_00860 [Desulfobacteraceae bacterium]|nr:hypothetical protein [Desulfobacteraceae bacterium]
MWRLLLRQLQKYRHQRPADSIVLSINCSDLIMSDTDNRDHFYARIVRKAGLLYEKLRDAQKILGMRFPVYVLITGCECIRGFEEFCKELPPDMIGNMFGWSVPYSTDTIFSPDWVSEAFRHISSIPAQTSLELFARGTHAENRDGLFIFPGNLQPLTEPIRVFLDHIFRQSAYHETYTLRGIYFCGKGAFVKDVFDRKIFPERAIARPMKDAAVSRNRMVAAFQVAAILFTVAAGSLLWRDAVRLNADQKSMSRFIGNIDKDMTNLRAKNLDGAYGILFYKLMQEKEMFLGHSLLNLAQGMSDLKVMKYIAIPSSWFSSLHSGISKAITEAYNEIIFKDIYIRLIHKLGTVFDILNTGSSKEIAEGHDIFSVEKNPEFAAMRLFADRMKEFETHAELYNNLNISTDVKALGQVIEYLYKIKLPASFYLNEKYCKDALKKAEFRKYDVATFQIKTNIVTLKPVIGKAFTHNVLLRHLKTLALQMESFGEKSRSAEHDEQVIRDLLEMISRTQAILEQQEMMWIFRENPELGKPFDELMYDIENLRFFGSELRKKLDTEVGTAFQALRNDLRDQSSSLTGPLLKREGGNITNILSPAVLRLKSDLERLLKQKFMVLEKARETDIVIPADMRLIWNTDMLEEATRLFEPYQGYIGSDLKALPKEMHRAVSNVARRNIEHSLLDKIARAYQLKPIAKGSSGEQKEAELRAEIRNFKEASKYLGNLLSYSEQLDLSDSYRMLSEIAFHQAARLLTAASNMLDQEEFYRSKGKDFSWWDGKSRLSLSAFGVSDQKELEYYLGVQRERIRYLAYEYAEPMVGFFSAHKLLKNRKEEQLMFRWERILTELEKYETRQPDNSVAALEKLILFDLDSVKPEDYSLKININDIRQHSSDMFLRKRNEMLNKLYLRCQRIAMENAIAQYGEIRSFFEAKLSGRFPFSMILDQQVFIEAKPEDIRDFYRIFDKTAPLIVNMLKAADMFGNSREDVGLFLSQMSDVRKLFAAYIEKDKKESKEDKKDAKPPADKKR